MAEIRNLPICIKIRPTAGEAKNSLTGKKVLQLFDYKETSQPAIVQHPETGRKALYINRLMTATIEGIPQDKARDIIEEVILYAEHPFVIYEHKWKTGDFLVWDNRCSTHARNNFPSTERRLLKRGMLEGTPLIGA